MNHYLRFAFFQLLIRPLISIVLGLNVRHRQRLPVTGPAIIVANHNSHLDTMVLMTLLPWALQKKTRPVAAADYFLKNRALAWFSRSIIGIIPIQRRPAKAARAPFADIQHELDQGHLIIFYPEGSRGEPEKFNEMKRGITHLLKANPQVPVYPIFIYGLGKILPKNEALLVPFVIDLVVGEPFYGQDNKEHLIEQLTTTFQQLQEQIPPRTWE